MLFRSVHIESIVGDLSDLVGVPLLVASEDSLNYDQGESCTATFYKFATVKGYVDVRWFGTSNGYYSERVDLEVDGCRRYDWDDTFLTFVKGIDHV